LVDGKNVQLSEEEWHGLKGDYVAVCKTPVAKEGDEFRSVGMPENILILPKGTSKAEALKSSKSLWRLSIPGKMWDFTKNAIEEERGVARAFEQNVDYSDPGESQELNFKEYPKHAKRLRYWGKKLWSREDVFEVQYVGFWKNNKFHGPGTLEFTWYDDFKKGRAAHLTVQKVQGCFDTGDIVGDAKIQYTARSKNIQMDIKEYQGPCLLEEDDGSNGVWNVYKHGEGTTQFFSGEKPSKDRWNKDVKVSHVS